MKLTVEQYFFGAVASGFAGAVVGVELSKSWDRRFPLFVAPIIFALVAWGILKNLDQKEHSHEPFDFKTVVFFLAMIPATIVIATLSYKILG